MPKIYIAIIIFLITKDVDHVTILCFFCLGEFYLRTYQIRI